MKEALLNFKLTEVEGKYGVLFEGSKPIGIAMFNTEDYSLSVAFKKNQKNKFTKRDVLGSVLNETNKFYGMHDYYVTVSDAIFEVGYKRFQEFNN